MCFSAFFIFLASNAFALSIPDKPQAYVNDYAGLLSPAARAKIEAKLAAFEKETSNQVVVAIFNSLEGESLEDFSMRLAEKWKIGSQKNDNGVILLIFKEDRAMRLEVGYGLEGVLPDALADQIIRREIVSAFRSGDFDLGVSRGIDAVINATQGEYRATSNNTADQTFAQIFFFIFALGCLVAMGKFAGSKTGRTLSARHGHGHGSIGGFGGGGFSGGGGGFSGGGGGGFGGGGSSGRW